ncbi:MAG: hypothetical protein GWO78_03145 [Dehalococcoidales bacterium]|nr:hypothetical protein [Dehalococcoidales bacterium]
MNPKDIKKTLQSGGSVFGTMINFVEGSRWGAAFSSKALDYIIIDAEHGSYSRGEIARMVAIGQSVGLTVIVRVADPDPTLVAIALDAKADGVLVPYSEDAEMIQRCAWKVQLHPLKGKAFEDVLSSETFPSKKTKDYLNKRNGHKIMIVGIESITAVNDLDNLISKGPIDGVFVGPNDLSTSMGIPDELETKEYLDTLTKIIKVSESHNIPVMVHGFSEERTLKTMELGSRFVLHSSDGMMISGSIDKEFTAIRGETIDKTESEAI